MLCRITDENVFNPWDGEDVDEGTTAKRSISDMTFYDLMAEDFTVWIGKNKTFGFDLELENDEGEIVVDEKGIHPCAMESYADMCRRFLHFYDKLKAKDEEAFDKQLEVA